MIVPVAAVETIHGKTGMTFPTPAPKVRSVRWAKLPAAPVRAEAVKPAERLNAGRSQADPLLLP